MEVFKFGQNGIYLYFCITDDGEIKLIRCSRDSRLNMENVDAEDYYWNRLVEVHLSGENQNDHHFSKHTGSSEGFSLKYVKKEEKILNNGKLLRIDQKNPRIYVETYYRFYNNISVFKTWSVVKSISENITVEHISSFNLLGTSDDWENKLNIYIPHNCWQGECHWLKYSLRELGLYNLNVFSGKRIHVTNSGTMSTKEYLPMGVLENSSDNEFLLWQIESSSSWNWELSTMSVPSKLYLMLNGPSFSENGWYKNLKCDEEFVTVPVAVALGNNLENAFKNITGYRRMMRNYHQDNEKLSVIFNDYMNCLGADPTTEKEIPLIDRAAELGCEYYCIDAGWYSEGYWWDNVGEWFPCEKRFNNDFKGLLDYIRSKGMIPGLWLEIEVMGIKCPLAERLPDNFFFMRNGKRVIDHSRYQLDFSNSEVVEYADSVVNRLVNEYKIGYLKMDYNINAGIGTECNSDSFGDGLLKHSRAYLRWLDGVIERYPDLVIENCASGGSRMDYAMLKRLSIQSASDQTDYRLYSVISANCISAVTPEQAAVWSYPLKDGDEEEVAYNMVNCLLFRIHQSGNIADLSHERYSLVKEAIELYKNVLRKDIPHCSGIWPLGLAKQEDPFISFGLRTAGKIYLAVWNQTGTGDIHIPLKKYNAKSCKILYPEKLKTVYEFKKDEGTLIFHPDQKYSARLFKITT